MTFLCIISFILNILLLLTIIVMNKRINTLNRIIDLKDKSIKLWRGIHTGEK